MEERNFIYDTHVIRLIKSTAQRELTGFFSNDRMVYVCLGHFDLIDVKKLQADSPTSSPLEVIRKDSLECHCKVNDQNGKLTKIEENFAYPLYILRQFEDSAEGQNAISNLNIFWSLDTNILVVTRLHCDRIEESSATFPQILSKRFKDDQEVKGITYEDGTHENGYITLNISSINNVNLTNPINVYVAFYESLELGDVVGVIKSNSLAAILMVLRQLYESDVVRDAYTYCGIDQKLFDGDEDKLIETVNGRDNLLGDIFLPYVSTRFSVKDIYCADNFLNKVFKDNSKDFFVTGTADIVIDWSNRTELDFLKTIWHLIHSDVSIYAAFDDIITQVGLLYAPPAKRKTHRPKFIRPTFCDKIPEYQEVINILEQSTETWCYPLIKLLGTLRTMYENCVMDDLSDLLVSGVHALLKRILHMYKHDTITARDNEDIEEFLGHWMSLTNDIAHLESQLVQHPELNSVRYFIPAMVLRFEQKLVSEYVEIIHSLNQAAAPTETQNKQRIFNPILFICSEQNVSTQCFLDPEYDSSYIQESPLGIFIPIQQLYRPWEIAHILCHEIAHYCGDYLRNREKRLDCLIESSATFMLAFWSTYLQSPNCQETIEDEITFRQEIAVQIKQQYPGNDVDSRLYLKFISEKLPPAVMKVAYKPENLEKYQSLVLKLLSAQEQLENIYAANKINTMDGGVIMESMCRDHILNCLIPLYKECYADIFMILLLDCKFLDYYQCVYANEYIQAAGNIRASEHHSDRMAIVGLTIQKIKGPESWVMLSDTGSEWINVANEKIEKWNQVSQELQSPNYRWHRHYLKKTNKEGKLFDTINPYTLLANEAAQLLSYLHACAESVNNQLQGLDKDSPIYKKLKSVREYVGYVNSNSFNWNEIRTYVEEIEEKRTSSLV